MNIVNSILDILFQADLYENSEKYKKDKKLLDEFLITHGKPIEKKEDDGRLCAIEERNRK